MEVIKMKEYTIYTFEGRYKEVHNSGDDWIIKSPIKSVLENLSFYCRDMKSFFESKGMVFYSESFDMASIRNMVENGRVIIPISSSVHRDEVLNYINIGLHPLFMKAKEYNQFKKDYTLEA
jgi:hypothetical protein